MLIARNAPTLRPGFTAALHLLAVFFFCAPSYAGPELDLGAEAQVRQQGIARATRRIMVEEFGPVARALSSRRLNELSTAARAPLRYVRAMSGNSRLLELPQWVSVKEATAIADRLALNPNVRRAEPDLMVFPTLEPDDTLYPDQWHYFDPSVEEAGINLPSALEITIGAPDVVIGVLDSGITAHEDLFNAGVVGYDFIDDVETANDGDGRDADASDPGDWVSQQEATDPSSWFFGCPIRNSLWHGTHVTGTIGADSNNAQGVAGINWVSPVLPVRVLGKCGGWMSDVIDGMRWAAGLPVDGVPANLEPAKVLNLSLTAVGACGTFLQTAIDEVNAAGTTIVVAAGNDGVDAANYSPAGCEGVLTVAAVARDGSRPAWSNSGAAVDISAPGVGIWSTANAGVTVPAADIYAAYSGTSMAAPHVAGVVSLLYALEPTLDSATVREIVQASARPFPLVSTGIQCTTESCGAGIVDAQAALTLLTGINESPEVNIATPLDGATFSAGQAIDFSASADDTEDGDLSASLQWSSDRDGVLGSGASLSRSLTVGSHRISATVTDSGGLSAAASVQVSVAAANSAPQVSIATPLDGATFSAGQAIDFSASADDTEDGDLSASLQWSSDRDGVLGSGASLSRSLTVGSHRISATVTDSGGLSAAASVQVSVAAANSAPQVSIATPLDGATFSAGQAIDFSASADDTEDGDLSASLQWSSDRDGALGSGASLSRSLTVGSHRISATVTDSGGLSAAASVQVSVAAANSAPQVNIATPLDGATFSAGQAIDFSASADDTEDGDLSASLQWSSDRDGALGSGASLSRSLTVGSHRISATVTDSGGLSAAASVQVSVEASQTAPITVTLFSIGAEDGWVRESSETSNTGRSLKDDDTSSKGLLMGDDSKDKQYRSLLSFDTAPIPDGATIVSVSLWMKYGTVSGTDPFATHGELLVDAKAGVFGASQELEKADFQAPATAADVASLSRAGPGAWSEATLDAAGRAAINKFGRTQLRVYFALDDNDDKGTDRLGYYSGSSKTPENRPQLVVTYRQGTSQNTAPQVSIATPLDGATFSAGQAIDFSASADDGEDGDLSASLQWSSDRDGVLGSGASLSRSLTVGSHRISATVTDSGGLSAAASVQVSVAASQTAPITVTLFSIGAEDGWVRESSETSNAGGSLKDDDTSSKGLLMGDDSKDKQYRSLLSFDTASIPDGATIVSVSLWMKYGTVSGTDPFATHGELLVDAKAGVFGASQELEKADFQAPATAADVASLSRAGPGAWSEATLNAAGRAAINKFGRTQLRVYFALDDNDDKGTDRLGYYSGSSKTPEHRPQLVVTYRQ